MVPIRASIVGPSDVASRIKASVVSKVIRRLVEFGLKGKEMKTPGQFESPKPITKAERDARKTFRKLDAEKAMTEHEIEQKAFSANRERLKAERLTREAAGPPIVAKKAKTKRKAR
jgi:hypothetical protein